MFFLKTYRTDIRLNFSFAGCVCLFYLFFVILFPRDVQAATYTVDSLNDAGAGSGLSGDLRYALTNAGSGDTINFSVSGTISLTSPLPAVTQNLSIVGANSIQINGSGAYPIFNISPGVDVSISGVILANGLAQGVGTAAQGGAIYDAGNLVLTDVDITTNQAVGTSGSSGQGGGVYLAPGATLNINADGQDVLYDNNIVGGGSPSGADLYINSNVTLNADSGRLLSLTDSIDGPGGLNSSGPGTVMLSGINSSYSGPTSVLSGTLAIGNGDGLPVSTTLYLAAGATFFAGENYQHITTLAGEGTMRAIGFGGLVLNDSASTTFYGNLWGGDLYKLGTGTLILSGAPGSVSSRLLISNGTIKMGAPNVLNEQPVYLYPGCVLDLNDFDQYIGPLYSSGNVNLGSAELSVYVPSSATFSGIISGTGGVRKTGFGTWTLAGNNTYTGGTTIYAGTLKLGTSNALDPSGMVYLGGVGSSNCVLDLNGFDQTIDSLNGNWQVKLNSGSLTFDTLYSGTYYGTISGTGNLVKDGPGTQSISYDNHSGATSVLGGLLWLTYITGNSAAYISSEAKLVVGTGAIDYLLGMGELQINGPLNIGNGNQNSFFSGDIIGIGGITKTGSGALTLTGTNTYSGGTTVLDGTLCVGGVSPLGQGNLILDGTTLQAVTNAILSNDTILTVNNGIIDTQSNDMTMGGTISGIGTLAVTGTSGRLTFTGTGNFSGPTSVLGGTLELAPSAVLMGPITVTADAALQVDGLLWGQIDNSGNLQGVGQITGNITNIGTVHPGNWGTLGTLHVEGDYSQSPGGNLSFEVLPTAAGTLTVAGTANLDGLLNVNQDDGNWGVRYRYVILSTDTMTGSFAVTAFNTLPGWSPVLSNGSNSITLTLTRTDADFGVWATGANQKAVALVLNQSVATGSDAWIDRLNEIYTLPSGQRTALSGLTGQIYTTLPNVMLDNSQFEHDLIFARLRRGYSADMNGMKSAFTGNVMSLDVLGDTGHTTGFSTSGIRGLWVADITSVGSVNASPDVIGFEKSNSGFLAGYDTDISPILAVGFMGGYIRTDVTASDANSKAGVDQFQLGLYGNIRFGTFDFGAVVGYGLDYFDADRSILIGNDMSRVTGKFNGHQIDAAIQLADRVDVSGIEIKPLVGLKYARLYEDAITEQGSNDLSLAIPGQVYDSLRPYLGVNGEKAYALGGNIRLIPNVNLFVSEELMKTAGQFQTSLSGAPDNSFAVVGISPSETMLGASGGFALAFGKKLYLFANYNGYFSGTQNLNTFNGGANLTF